MSEEKKGTGGSIFASLLAVLFIGLKLGGVIDWRWIWVLSPIWISFAIAVVLVGVFALFLIIMGDL